MKCIQQPGEVIVECYDACSDYIRCETWISVLWREQGENFLRLEESIKRHNDLFASPDLYIEKAGESCAPLGRMSF